MSSEHNTSNQKMKHGEFTKPPVRAARSRRGFWRLRLVLGLGLLLIATGSIVLVIPRGQEIWKQWTEVSKSRRRPLTALSNSPYLNTGAEARYVGSATCQACHPDTHASFRNSGMGQSMALVDAIEFPTDADFAHPISRRRYQVREEEGKLWHREWLLQNGQEDVLLAEFPLKYVVGSGRHGQTFLVETNDFLVESPLTWYSSRATWGMSPGYDLAENPGFERAIGEGCLYCHAGQAEAIDASLHKIHFRELAISCERCHGPGSLHLARHNNREPLGPRSGREIDWMIVNPADLSRELAESICQQCHLATDTKVRARGREPTDFRPGLPLQDFLHAFVLERPDEVMSVVGHVEQMHRSPCYQGSETLSCLTCHNPHDEPRPEERLEYYKAHCLECHQVESCTVEPAHRHRKSPENNCVTCHMPTGPVEIPHLAFTHHRIGIHEDEAPTTLLQPSGPLILREFFDLSRFDEVERNRSRGLAYQQLATRQENPAHRTRFRLEALDLLNATRSAGIKDPLVDLALARLRSESEALEILKDANSALASGKLKGQDLCDSLALKGMALNLLGRHEEAIPIWRRLSELRQSSVDWLKLADSERLLGRQVQMVEALNQAVRINPRLWKTHLFLANYYRSQGDLVQAAWHERRVVP